MCDQANVVLPRHRVRTARRFAHPQERRPRPSTSGHLQLRLDGPQQPLLLPEPSEPTDALRAIRPE